MFSKLPQKFTSPFGLLGDDTKLSFRTQANGIRQLVERRNISEADAYWDQYVTLFDTTSDVFSLISSSDIRRALVEAPENVATLIRVLSSKLFNLVSDHTFPTKQTQSVSSIASTFIKSAGSSVGVSTGSLTGRNPTLEALNCLRVLERVLPLLFESDFAELEQEVLWTRDAKRQDHLRNTATTRGEEAREERPQFVLEDEDEDEDRADGSLTSNPQTSQTTIDSPSINDSTDASNTESTLAERLIACSIDLLFCCGFTLPPKLQVDHYKINYVIWEKGVGSTLDPGPTQAQDQNKAEVLRFILVLLSRQMYTPAANLLTSPSPYSLFFVQKTPRRHVLAILCSLLNTAMNSSHPTPARIGNVASTLPYNHLVFKGEDQKTTVVSESLQLLCALLDFQSGPARDVLVNPMDPSSATPTAKSNAFRYFLAKLHRQSDFQFVADGILGIFEQQINIMNNLLPGSKKPLPYVIETIVFFWKMIELNKKFRSFIFSSEKSTDLVVYLLCFCMDAKDKPHQHGLCRMISYILQALSAEREFNDKISSPVKVQLPAKWAFNGTLGDFMVNAIYSIMATTSGALNSLYPALVIALSNSAPFYKYLSVQSANRLVSLFKSFANPSFLLSDEGHPRLLFFLLEVFNGVLYSHPSENPNLLYAILRSHKSFQDMGTFTLARGLRELRRVQKAKEEQARKNSAEAKKGSSEQDQEAPEVEKARLLTSESRDMIGLSADVDLEARLPRAPPKQPEVDSEHDDGGQHDQVTIPLMSPTSEGHPIGEDQTPRSISEKARGKMRERPRSSSVDTTGSLERIAAAGVGRNGFVPTQDWVTSWQQGLPLDPILIAISELLPKVQDMQTSSSKASAVTNVLDLLKSVSLTHVLPERPAIIARRFLWSDSSIVWLTSLIWGEIYVKGMSPLSIWNATNVRLFHVKHTPSPSRQISDTVSQVMGGLGGLLAR